MQADQNFKKKGVFRRMHSTFNVLIHHSILLLSLFPQAFDVVDKSFFETIDDALAEKASLSNYLLPPSEVRPEQSHTILQPALHNE